MPVEQLVGYCLTCNHAHTESETFTMRGLLRCKQTHALVEAFAVPVPLEQEAAMREAIRVAIDDMAFHAGVDRSRNRQALDEIVEKFCQMAESEQGK